MGSFPFVPPPRWNLSIICALKCSAQYLNILIYDVRRARGAFLCDNLCIERDVPSKTCLSISNVLILILW